MFYEFGEILRQAREGMGWTRLQASMKINDLCTKRESVVSPVAIEKWENGKVLPKLESTVALARAYRKPELIQLRIEAVELNKKAACTAMQTA